MKITIEQKRGADLTAGEGGGSVFHRQYNSRERVGLTLWHCKSTPADKQSRWIDIEFTKDDADTLRRILTKLDAEV